MQLISETKISGPAQNVSGTSDNIGLFYYGWPEYSMIRPGWTCVQTGAVVVAVGDGITDRTITTSGTPFASGGEYRFTGPTGIELSGGLQIIKGPPNVYTNNLVMQLDAANYTGSGTWVDTVASKSFTLHNSPTYGATNGGYINFSPASQQFADSTSFASSLSNWTLEVWHYYDGTLDSGSPCLVTEAFAGGAINFTLGNCSDSAPNLQTGHWDGSNFYPNPQGTVLTSGNWYHIVGTYDGSNHKLYVNGSLVSFAAATSAATSAGAGIRLMRRWDADQYWGGKLSVVRIYDADIGADHVSQNYNAQRNRFGI